MRETPDIVARINGKLLSVAATKLLDWGCGIGRLARPLCHDYGFQVTGVDLSPDMRRLAVTYVGHPDFEVLGPMGFIDQLDERGHSYDAAVAAWALQHIPKLEQACRALADALRPGAPLFLLNRVERVIPVIGGWVPDGKDVPTALRGAGFTLEVEEQLGPPLYATGSVWSVWRAA